MSSGMLRRTVEMIAFCFYFLFTQHPNFFGVVVVIALFTFLFPERRIKIKQKTSQYLSDGIITDGLGY